jgi:7-cyano-7-deazaguanine synthase
MSDDKRPGSVILLSGGLDSAVLLYQRRQLYQEERALFPLFIDYAQRALYHERRAAEFHCAKLGLELQVLDLSSAGRDFRSVSGVNLHVPVPHRNLPLLSFAVSYAALKGCDTVELGVIADDLDQDRAFSLEFWRAFAQVAASLGLRLELPFVGRSKGWVVALGRELGVDFDATFSCICGVDRACGRCRQCRQRQAAFEYLGVGPEDERE